MSLDQNLFTLNIVPRANAPHIVELIDPQETVHYRKERVDGPTYAFNVFDPLSESLLCTVSAPAATSKAKVIELHNPSVPVELRYTGTFTFRWSFIWEEHEFEWKREECHMIRKPDPPVLVAITKEPPGKIKSRAVQILDYNINRFDIQDRKGLEIVLLSALLSFADYSEGYHSSPENASTSARTSSVANIKPSAPITSARTTERAEPVALAAAPPPPPPKPRKSGAERIAEMQKGELNDILITEEGEIEDYAQYCSNLLEGDNMLFVVLRSSSPTTVPKVLQVAHQTKRIRHKAGDDSELHQYVQYDTTQPSAKKGPRVIKLDDNAADKDKYKPPENLLVHLSKIPMPELQPKAKPRSASDGGIAMAEQSEGSKVKDGKDEKRRREREDREKREREKKEKREKEKLDKGKGRSSELGPAEAHARPAENSSSRLTKRRSPSPSPGPGRRSHSHTPAHRTHPTQPSPSPSQINNPSIYTAPPPRRSPAPGSAPTSTLYPPYAPYATARPYPDPSHLVPGAYPAPQRPTSAYGGYMGSPQQPLPQAQAYAQSKPMTPSALVNGLLDKLRL